VAEPIIQKQGVDRILVQLPGVKDVDEAKKTIGQVAELDFREAETVKSDGHLPRIQKWIGKKQWLQERMVRKRN